MRKLREKECENKQQKYRMFIRKIKKETTGRKEELKEKYRRKIEHLSDVRRK